MTDLKVKAQEYLNSIKRSDNFPVSESIPKAFIQGAKWMQERDKWISVDALPVAGTECYFVVQFTNEFGIQNVQHTGIFGALGFTSYHDSEHYSIKEVTKHFPLPSPPKTK